METLYASACLLTALRIATCNYNITASEVEILIEILNKICVVETYCILQS